MKKRILSIILTLVLCLGPACPAFAIEKTQVYSDEFTDISGWSESYIKQAYEFGLMNGMGNGKFSPKGTVAVAQVITVAARLNDIYNGGTGEITSSGSHWYDGAVDYALARGIITNNQFADYTRAAKRSEIAGVLVKALPASEFPAINSIKELPDVNSKTAYSDAIFTLYNAGVLSGGDKYGTYEPDANLTREALAAIITRVCDSSTRMTLRLEKAPPDLTVRTSSKALKVMNLPLYGVMTVGGEYYIHLDGYANDDPLRIGVSSYDGEIYIDHQWSAYDYQLAPPEGKAVGKATVAEDLEFYENSKPIRHLQLGGRYDMICLNDFDSFSVSGDIITIQHPFKKDVEYTPEYDLIGEKVRPLIKASDRDTVKAIHDYLVNTLTYEPYTQASYEAYERAAAKYEKGSAIALASGYGICQNYADLFCEMCVRAGIPCEVVSGSAKGEGHAWNRVYLDGKWWHIDCTWDDPVSSKPKLIYTYYLVEPMDLVKDHVWYDSDYPLSLKYDPAWEKIDPNNITTADMFRQCLAAQLMMKKEHFSLRCTKSGAYGGIAFATAVEGVWFSSLRSSYNSKTNSYDFTVTY